MQLMRNSTALVCTLLAMMVAAYTQLTHLVSVPGLHFDEAWQGLFAHKLGTIAGYRPSEAMNSYTSPVVHHLLSAVFSYFGPTIEVMRGTYAVMNLGTVALIAALLWRLGERLAVAWFAIFWALLPLSVHDHRFYVELTGFHGLCLAALLWGLALWKRAPFASFALIVVAMIAGVYSHILFVACFLAGIFALARSFPAEFRAPRAQALLATTALLLMPLPIRMGLGLYKSLPFALAAGLGAIALWAALTPRWVRFERLWVRWPRRAMRLSKLIAIATTPFLFGFITLLWNGPWAYAQATGHLLLWWMPINAGLFLLALYHQACRVPAEPRPMAVFEQESAQGRTRLALSPSLVWGAFTASFLITSVLILKQSPRYYTVPMILAMIWVAQRMARLRSQKLQLSLAALFVTWNLALFHYCYLFPYREQGATTIEFKLGPYHDNARDFRPFQKLFSWAQENGCLTENNWVEDDRFKLPFDFLKLTTKMPPAGHPRCPYEVADLFFSHIPNYDPNLNRERTDENTPPPEAAPNVKYLAHFPEWGDLAVWIRRKPIK